MANLKGSGKGGRKRIYGDLPLKERQALSQEKTFKDKRKINFTISEEAYQKLIRLENDSGYKFHSDMLDVLLEVYESVAAISDKIKNNKDTL